MSQELHSLILPITSGGTTTPTEFSVDYLARKDGIVNTAENLMGDSADVEFTSRTVSGSGVSKTEKVSGNSMVWNQLFSASGVSVTIPEGHKYISKLGTTWAYGTGASGGTTVTSTSATDMLFDVTKMGAYWATKYTTVNAFKVDYPKDYYAYEPGKVINNCTTGIKSKKADNTEIATLSLPLTTLTGTPTGGSTAEVMFADGMVSVGNVADELLPTGTATKRFGKVDLGSLDWVYITASQRFLSVTISGMKIAEARNVKMLCSRYVSKINNEPYVSDWDKVIYNSNDEKLYVHDHSYTDAAAFKAAMSGVYLYYEKATPVEYTFSPITDTLTVEDGGTLEQLVPTGTEPTSAPFKGKMRFPIKAQEKLVSGTNIKTVNGNSLLGSGNIVISGGGGASAWGQITGTLSNQTDLNTALGNKENTSNKVTSLTSASTNTQYPSAKCVYDLVGNVEAALNAIRGVS